MLVGQLGHAMPLFVSCVIVRSYCQRITGCKMHALTVCLLICEGYSPLPCTRLFMFASAAVGTPVRRDWSHSEYRHVVERSPSWPSEAIVPTWASILRTCSTSCCLYPHTTEKLSLQRIYHVLLGCSRTCRPEEGQRYKMFTPECIHEGARLRCRGL